ncbi:MAG: hypothetical protein Q8K63_12925, partial [Acidimicrobiales bacterium]|nr:hypothetical protein [Acidimicrobiales bacterium]
MTFSPRARKVALTVHVLASVGWLGVVVATLGLAVAALVSDDVRVVSSAYVSLGTTARFLLVPLSLASLGSGVVQSLGTRWGLLRHWWVIFKLGLNVFASVVLVLYLETLDYLGTRARVPEITADALRDPSPVLHAAGALVLLIAA